MKNVIILLVSALFFLGCENKEMETLKRQNGALRIQNEQIKEAMAGSRVIKERLNLLQKELNQLRAKMITSKGEITLRFFPAEAPLHVMNFVLLAEGGFYNRAKFHRVIKGFMIQGGDPNSKDNNWADDGTGGSILRLPAEFNRISHKRGILSMARSQNPNSASSQFFIMHQDNPRLDGQYTVFGEVVKGMEVVDAIADVETNKRDHPLKDVVIKKIEIYRVK
jgi:peptidyl-prolyl cis-trans isomerase B (cyclophilin B)